MNIGAVLLVSGCSYKHEPKAYVCIEKPPIKTTYIDFEKDITPETVRMMINETSNFKYQDTSLNDKNEIIIDYNGNVKHEAIDSTSFLIQ